MFKVRVKKYIDSVQYQIYEDNVQFSDDSTFDFNKAIDDRLGTDSRLYGRDHSIFVRRIKKDDQTLVKNPFTDSYELLTEYKVYDKHQESVRCSVNRTIKKIYDIGRSNVWDYFLTFTFNPDKVDSFDYSAVSKKLINWLKIVRRKCPDMVYLVVPEMHKSGRYHFHGLFANIDALTFFDSGKRTDRGQVVYNLVEYNLGFSTAINVDGSSAIVSYLTKYITKDLAESTFGKKRYWSSRNVKLPEVLEHVTDDTYMQILDKLNVADADFVKTINSYKDVTYIEFNKKK